MNFIFDFQHFELFRSLLVSLRQGSRVEAKNLLEIPKAKIQQVETPLRIECVTSCS